MNFIFKNWSLICRVKPVDSNVETPSLYLPNGNIKKCEHSSF